MGRRKKRIIQSIIMLSVVICGFITSAVDSFAASIYQLDVLIDQTNGQFIGNIEYLDDYAVDTTLNSLISEHSNKDLVMSGPEELNDNVTIDKDGLNEVLKDGPDAYEFQLDSFSGLGKDALLSESLPNDFSDASGRLESNEHVADLVRKIDAVAQSGGTMSVGIPATSVQGVLYGLTYNFPSIYKGGISGQEASANEGDAKLAYRITETIIPDLNSAISWCANQVDETPTMDNYLTLAIALANNTQYNFGDSASFTWLGELFTIKQPDSVDDLSSGSKASDYIYIECNGIESKNFQYRVPKGYREIDSREDKDNNSSSHAEDIDIIMKSADRSYFTWQLVVYKGLQNYCLGYDFYNMPEGSSSVLTQYICGFINDCLSSLRSLLGLYSLENLMMNSGARATTYSYGLFPRGWMGAINLLHIICQILAWSAIGLSILRVLHKKQMSTISTIERVAFMDEIKQLLITGCAIGLFPVIFNILARANTVLVNLFTTMTSAPNELTVIAGNANSIGSLLIAIMMFFVTLYFNFMYMVRAVTLAILYGVGPICIYSLSLGRQNHKIFSTYTRNLGGEMFMQTFHALTLAFFCNITMVGGLRKIELIVVMYSFIPLTKLIQDIIQPDRKPSQIADKLQGAAAGVIGGITGAGFGMVGGALAGNGGKGNGKSNGKNSSSVLSQKIQENKSNGQTGPSFGDKVQGMLTDSESKGKAFNSITGNKNPITSATSLAGGKGNMLSKTANTLKGLGTAGLKAGLGITEGVVGAGMSLSGVSSGAKLMDNAGKHMSGAVGDVFGTASGLIHSISENKELSKNLGHLGFSKAFNCNNGEYTALVSDAYVDETGKFENGAVGIFSPEQKELYQDIYDAFNGTGSYDNDINKQKEAKAYYDRFGIKGCGSVSYKDNGSAYSLLISNHMGDKGDFMNNLEMLQKFTEKPKSK